jgi:crotonobetainyl-CoA:carnitine CoA-transferase CaiB-like acyl-CoA transferase
VELTLLNHLMAVAGEEPADDIAEIAGADPVFPLVWPVGEAGAAAIAATGVAAARLWQTRTGRGQRVRVEVDAAAAAMRGDRYLVRERPGNETEPSPRAVRGERGDIYRAKDGRWVYLHRGFAHHRARIADLLGGANDEAALEKAVAGWNALELEDAVHATGACAGMVRTYDEWRGHEQGQAVAALPLIEIDKLGDSPPEPLASAPRPLTGVRVLDLTRVLAGPTCARTLAEHGADVLRIGTDRLPNNEAQNIATGHGKRSTVLDLTSASGHEALQSLVKGADVFSQGYRPGSLAAHGFGIEEAMALRPGIVYVTLSAFSHDGPWRGRRGFDTLVQTVSGIANDYANAQGRPRLLPVSALDYTTGYLAAFGTMVALRRRAVDGGSYRVRVSLAQTAAWLLSLPRFAAAQVASLPPDLPPERIAALCQSSETPFGRLTHLAPIVQLSETPARWDLPSVPLDHDPPRWLESPLAAG